MKIYRKTNIGYFLFDYFNQNRKVYNYIVLIYLYKYISI